CSNSSACVDVSTRSFTATASTSGVRSISALSDWRPIRPNPLMPTRTAIVHSSAKLQAPIGLPWVFDLRTVRSGFWESSRTSSVMMASYDVGMCGPFGRRGAGPMSVGWGRDDARPLAGKRKAPAGCRQGPDADRLGSGSAADLEDLAAALGARALQRGLAVLHRDSLGVHDFDFHLVLDTIRFSHG